jgi:intracellular sulfur oxidation DsrE/DsrF family protein
MKNAQETTAITDEFINAFVDGELDSAEKSRLLELAAGDGALRERICALWHLKEMIGNAYPQNQPRQPHRAGAGRFRAPRFAQALAASVLLALGGGTGWLMHGAQDARTPAPFVQAQTRQAAEEMKLVLHVFSGEDVRFEAALDEAEQLLRNTGKDGRQVHLDIVANSEGLRLLQADASPYPERIRQLQQSYRNLSFYACGTTIDKMRRKGMNVKLLPEAVITPSALDLIMTREKQGWVYIQA